MYVLIISLAALFFKQLSKKKTKKHICDRCLQYFGEERILAKYEEFCANMNNYKIRMPTENTKVSSKNEKNRVKVSFIIYADTESVLKSNDDEKKHQKHEMHWLLCKV